MRRYASGCENGRRWDTDSLAQFGDSGLDDRGPSLSERLRDGGASGHAVAAAAELLREPADVVGFLAAEAHFRAAVALLDEHECDLDTGDCPRKVDQVLRVRRDRAGL